MQTLQTQFINQQIATATGNHTPVNTMIQGNTMISELNRSSAADNRKPTKTTNNNSLTQVNNTSNNSHLSSNNGYYFRTKFNRAQRNII